MRPTFTILALLALAGCQTRLPEGQTPSGVFTLAAGAV